MGEPVFKKAIKYEAKGRIALVGPPGSGKSFTALKAASVLGTRIAAVDTEHGSLSKYADLFSFDVIEPDSYSVESWLHLLTAAEKAEYEVFITDSLSHYWMGKDGALEFVDERAKRFRGDSFSGWKEFRPHERAMVDRMIASPMHIICTMRTKTEYQEQEYINSKGEKKVKRVKIGLAPVQRDGLEYEFDLVGLMDDENNLIVDKSRCPALNGKALAKPGDKEFAVFAKWLSGEARPIEVPAPKGGPVPVPVSEIRQHTPQQQAEFAQQRAEEVAQKHAATPITPYVPPPPPDLTTLAGILASFDAAKWKSTILPHFKRMKTTMVDLKGDVGDRRYYEILKEFDADKATDFGEPNVRLSDARFAYEALWKQCLEWEPKD